MVNALSIVICHPVAKRWDASLQCFVIADERMRSIDPFGIACMGSFEEAGKLTKQVCGLR